MKKLIIGFLLVASVVSAAITGPFPIGPGATPLPSAVAVVTRFDVILLPTPYVIVSVGQFVSAEALAAGVAAGQTSFDMSAEDFQTYVLGPVSTGAIKDYQSGIEDWLIAKKLPGWTKL